MVKNFDNFILENLKIEDVKIHDIVILKNFKFGNDLNCKDPYGEVFNVDYKEIKKGQEDRQVYVVWNDNEYFGWAGWYRINEIDIVGKVEHLEMPGHDMRLFGSDEGDWGIWRINGKKDFIKIYHRRSDDEL